MFTSPYLSPLRYPGGKSILTRFLGEAILLNDLQGCDYYEPFVGAPGAALGLLSEQLVGRIFLNDLDPAIYAFWHSILKETESFLNLLQSAPITIDEWKRQKSIYQTERDDLLKLGFSTFYLNRCNRSGVIRSSGPIGGNLQNGKWKIGVRFNKDDLARRISEIAKARDKIEFTNLDALDWIRSPMMEVGSFIYLDPPYYKRGYKLYMNAFSDGDHKSLADSLRKKPDVHWILTYDNCDFIRDAYRDFKICDFSVRYSLQVKRDGEELLISSAKVVLPRSIRIGKNTYAFSKLNRNKDVSYGGGHTSSG